MPKQVIHGRQVEIHFAGELWPKRLDLQVDDHVSPKLQVVDEQVQKKLFATRLQAVLAANEGEADTEL